MPRFLRLAVAGLSAAVIASAGFLFGATLIGAVGPTAQGKGAGCGPGPVHCSTTQVDAFGSWQNADFTSVADISVVRSSFVVRPHGGPATISPPETVVFIDVFTPTINGVGCFVVPDSDFVVSHDLQSASLNAALTFDEQCAGLTTPVLGEAGVAPFDGKGGPPGQGLLLPIEVSATWTGPGSAFGLTSTAVQHCAGFTATFQVQGSSSQSTAVAGLVFGDGTTLSLGSSTSAGVDNTTAVQNANGLPSASCLVG